MHVHTNSSGMCTFPVLDQFCRESYNDPAAVYDALTRRGMTLVTLTDHDSIDGAEPLRKFTNFFVSEEVTCRMPSGTTVHVGVYGISERNHTEIQRRRNDLVSLLVYLTEKRIFFSVNHVLSSLTGRRAADDFVWWQSYFPAYETLNASMPAIVNNKSRELARAHGKIELGGSDSHTMTLLGRAWTEVPGARNAEEFLAGLRAGQGIVRGRSGSSIGLARDLLLVGIEMMRERKWTLTLAPLASLLPAISAVYSMYEEFFARRWFASALRQSAAREDSSLWESPSVTQEVAA
ncbi:MAG TPA: PHP-associated domain-containing protein [Candidatus Acidoferrales bacterium]|nr:PHP-associated domain-containing protein [Candidatus Acidoferrales bacterium]